MRHIKKAGYKRPHYKSFEYYLRNKSYVSLDQPLFLLKRSILKWLQKIIYYKQYLIKILQ